MSFESDNLVIRDLFEELERERALSTDLAADLATVSALLSEALAVLERQTRQLARQSDTISALKGLPTIGAGQMRRLVDLQEVDIPPRMTLVSEIRWTPFT